MTGKMERYVKISFTEKAPTSEAHYGALEAPSPKPTRPIQPPGAPHFRGRSHFRKQKSQDIKIPTKSFHKHLSGGAGHFNPMNKGFNARAKLFGPGGPGFGPPPGKSFHQKSNLRRQYSGKRPPFEGYAPPYPEIPMGEMAQNGAGVEGTESGGYGDAAQPIIVIEQHEKGGKDTCLRGCCIVCFCLLILLFAVAVTGFLLLYKNDLAPGLFRAKNDTKTAAPVGVITTPTISVANSTVTVAPTTTLKR